MYDSFKRNIDYLRISVTDRCNLRCLYCMPEEGICRSNASDLLSFEEITRVASACAEAGFTKLRITGGEPLVRRDLPVLVSMLSRLGGIRDLSMTTNGMLLGRYAEALRKAGLMRVNVSLDTLDAEKFRILTRGGRLEKVLKGIEAADSAGLFPIKINTVLNRLTTGKDIRELKAYSERNGYALRFICEMDREKGKFWPVEGGDGGHCRLCNRLRLSSDGWFYPCLFSSRKYPVRELGIREALKQALENKPENGKGAMLKKMCSIGG